MGVEESGSQLARGSAGPSHAAFPCFDGIRAIAALMIIVYHAVFFATWFETPGGTLLWNLNAGVWIFFVVSGFLLYRPFAAAHLARGAGVELPGYAVRRLARIYPAYWAVLAFFTFVVPRATIHGTDGFLLHVSLTQTYVHTPNPFLVGLPPAWSLVVELSFYVFLPCYAAVIGVCARRARQPLTVELVGFAVMVAVGLAAIVAVAEGVDAPWITVLPQHIAAFALGMLLAVLTVNPFAPATADRLARLGRPTWAWWTLALAVFVAIPVVLRIRPFAPVNVAQAIGLDVCSTLIGLFVVLPAVLGPQHEGAIRRVLRSRTLVFLGVISYGMYLWHWFVLQIVQSDWLGWPLREGNWVVVFVLAFPIIVGAATASWYLLERPVLRAAHSLTRRRAGRVLA